MSHGLKWIQLLVNVLDYELAAGPLLSEGADRLIERHPIVGRVCILAVGSLITLHLANLTHDRVDPLATNFWRGVRNGR